MRDIKYNGYTVEDAFKHCFYVVPDYQREYIWKEKQVNQLLEDINEEFDSNSPGEYFIGNILVSPKEDEKNHFDVIDGQQRLTTIFLILCALQRILSGTQYGNHIKSLLVDTYTDGKLKTNVRLQPRYENVEHVIEKLVQTDCKSQDVRWSIESSAVNVSGSIERILDAYDIICLFLKNNYKEKAKLEEYWDYLSSKVLFFQIETHVSKALKVFETINERGIGLNPMDLLKNLLFTRVESKKFPKLKREWKKVTKPLEKNKEKPLRFLRYFLMANYKIKNNRKDDILREDEIYGWLSSKDNAHLTETQDISFQFVHKIIQNVDLYIAFSNGFNNKGNPSLTMKSLKNLTGSAFSFHYVLLLAAAKLPESFFEQFIAQIESFLFYHLFTKTPSKYLERNFSIWADEIRDIANVENPEKQREKLNAFIDKRFSEDMNNKKTELVDALNRLTLKSMRKYRIRYLLARLTQHVEVAWGREASLENYLKLQIEHILPNKPKDDLLSRWGQEQDPENDYGELKNRLGNLTLLEKPLNIIAGNDFYKKKLPEYDKSGNYLTSSLSRLKNAGKNTSISRINEELSSLGKWDAKNKWDAKDIEQRQAVLIKLAQEVWKITEITLPRR